MPTMRIQMHLDGNASSFQTNVVHDRLVYAIYVVILGLQQKCGRGLARDVNVRIQLKLVSRPQMPGINCNCKIGPAAFPVCGIDR